VIRDGAVVYLTIDRRAQRNALTPDLIDGLIGELGRLDGDGEVRAVVLTGAGEAFCAGYDLNLLTSPGRPDAGAERDHVEALCSALARLALPTIAAVDGVASGAGCDLAVSCDLRIASERARFAMPPARIGLLYSREGSERLSALVGPAVAKEMLFTGALVDAGRAREIGLVNRVVPPSTLAAEVAELAAEIVANAPLSVAAAKRILDGASAEDTDALQRAVWLSEDAQEGPRAFRERRAPRFHGR